MYHGIIFVLNYFSDIAIFYVNQIGSTVSPCNLNNDCTNEGGMVSIGIF